MKKYKKSKDNNSFPPINIPSTNLRCENKNLYLDFYRYSTLRGKKLSPKLCKQFYDNHSFPLKNKISINQNKLLQLYEQHIHLEYTADKLFVGSALSPYSGDSTTVLHSLYGLPYIEGSSIKGLLRHCMIHEEYNSNQDEAKRDPFFKKVFGVGSDLANDNVGRGNFVFFDSFPKNKFKLEKDIQTPHYSEYYSSKGDKMPTDDSQPKPFKFYVAKETTFEIMIGVDDELTIAEIDKVKSYLKIALEDYGLGGKTNVGYGLGTVKFII